MCFVTEPNTKYYYREEITPAPRPVKRYHYEHGHHHHGHHHHHHHSPRASYTSYGHSPRVSLHSLRPTQEVVYERR